MKPIIIVGTGLAGYTVARELRKLDKTRPLLIITADDGGFYSKPMLSNAFAQRKTAPQLTSHTAAQMAEQLSATILTTTRALHIDAHSKAITTSAGVFEYEDLVIAVGAAPIRLPLQGDAADSVLSVNHLHHYDTFRAQLDQHAAFDKKRVAILGAGLIGCEFADDLAGAGYAVTLIDPNPQPLAAIAPPALSQGMAQSLRQRGVSLRLGTTATAINKVTDGVQVQLADGNAIIVDTVLSAVGLRPDLALAKSAGLRTERGIVIDRFGRSSDAHIYALGDCAEYTLDDGVTRTLPYVAPVMAAARAIASTLTGKPTPITFAATPVIVKTPSYPLALVPPPAHAIAKGEWTLSYQGDAHIARFRDESGTLLGFGVAPQQAALRQQLMGEMGQRTEVELQTR
jgi:rubredoxin-NAD+ reductase